MTEEKSRLETCLKHRGWWISVEFDKLRKGRKHFHETLALLEGGERYDLILENGKTVARGIFDSEAELPDLIRLIDRVKGWSGAVIYCNGQELDTGGARKILKTLKCAAAHDPPCRSSNRLKRHLFLGCHLSRIGLLGFSHQTLMKQARYWFSFFTHESWRSYRLKKDALQEAVKSADFCPLFPDDAQTIIDRLPMILDLDQKRVLALWVRPKERYQTRWLSRFPPVVPRSEKTYEKEMRNLLGIDGSKAPVEGYGFENMTDITDLEEIPF